MQVFAAWREHTTSLFRNVAEKLATRPKYTTMFLTFPQKQTDNSDIDVARATFEVTVPELTRTTWSQPARELQFFRI